LNHTVYTLLLALIGGSAGTAILEFVKFLISRYDEKTGKTDQTAKKISEIERSITLIVESVEAQREYLIASARDRISWLGVKYINAGFVGIEAFSDYEAMYYAYHKMGGNGHAKAIYEEVKKLDRIPDYEARQRCNGACLRRKETS